MDLGCKLIVGRELQEEPPCLSPFSYRGVCTEIFFYIFIFASEGRDGEEGDQPRVGGLVRPRCTLLMLSQCFLSLSLELVLRDRLGTLAHLMPGGQQKTTGRRLRPCPLRRGHPHAARRPPLVARLPTSPETLVAQPSGASVLGARGAAETVSCPRLPPQKRHRHTRPPADPRCHPNRRLRRPSRDLTGRAASSAVVLSCLVSPPPATPVFLLVFSPPLPLPRPAPSSLGSAQVNGSPPRLHGSPAHVTSPSRFFLCVYLSYFPSFPPFSFPLPPSSAM